MKIGDRVVCKRMIIYDGIVNNYYNKSGVILRFGDGVFVVKFDEKFTKYLHSEDDRCWNFLLDELNDRFYLEDDYLKNIQEKEKNKSKNILIDPFGEEIW